VREIAAAHKKLVRASEDDDINAFVEGDRDFYRVLSAAAHNRLVADTIPRIFNLHLRLWFYISHKLGGWHALAESHQQMTREVSEAVAKRQPAKAKAAMENYVARRQQDIRKVL
jgi:DNA-binding GntR family transcriptional regulator